MLVRDCMTHKPITIRPESDPMAAISLLTAGKFRHLPVIEVIKAGLAVRERDRETQESVLQEAILQLAAEHIETIMPGYTHMQKAQPVTLAHFLLAHYDAFARDPLLPKHRSLHASSSQAPPVNRDRYRWLSAYYDAQVEFPERLALAMLSDAESISRSVGLNFRVLAHHEARRRGKDHLRIGLNRADLDNQQFALNVVRWLGRVLD